METCAPISGPGACAVPPVTLLALALLLLVTSLLLCHRLHAERGLVDIQELSNELTSARTDAAHSAARAESLHAELTDLRVSLQQREAFLAQVLALRREDGGAGLPAGGVLPQEARTLPMLPVTVSRFDATGSSFAMSGEAEWPVHQDSSVHTTSFPQRMR
ncbi:unnamed protein product [Effrenium voratum]|uniref:Uncharacterized protein n=1 Tax=Effrenium voratum TaxID=2562239 RepID=A0AA36IEN2_9DINO|nr:unnamed protein product [Effrenium voratum]CAJ1385331.1 unnamed protein product [Effrenium voratum]|mmetsp:Transcript_71200/g.169990  ORF Transcript_71200/g.169990 Transcript_71200/m.169990 type:complete len:161 (+) Transcript_71200:27-509(+)